ncbi:hypothetical protein [Bifidobacterium simiarum]|uniref:Uncharacterized protein n=1 Tax=Bifidobacterium simiarum TaxID=2045441 RepID=A0A2M9HCL2_9BIFI|nr:hypothetical protein [Bifidobacterium simiarum]PJM74558.1 hypothetical protein CSQ87_09765 [Bifidobacterium simiarum]
MVMTMEHADDSGTALLDTGSVAELFRRSDPEGYDDARRRFYREVNMNPFKRHPDGVLRLIDWSFCDWFAFECAVDPASVDDDGRDGRPRLRLRRENGHGNDDDGHGDGGRDGDCRDGDGYAGPSKSPYLVAAERLYDCGRIGTAHLADMREVDATNFASMFWIDDANASRSRMRVKDVRNGRSYELYCPPDAAKYDGAHGGVIVNRIARVRGTWRPCAIAVYEARRPDGPDTRDALMNAFGKGGYHPDFPGWIRLFYGRAKDTGLDMEDMADMMGIPW